MQSSVYVEAPTPRARHAPWLGVAKQRWYATTVTLRFTSRAVSTRPVDIARRFVVAASLIFVGSCGPPAASRSSEPRSPAPAESSRRVASASTSYVVEDCPDAKKMDAKAVETAMRKLTEPCHDVKAPAADFLATLVPGGRIEIASRGKDSAEGVVPICVVRNRLTHSVALKQRCTFSVKLEPPAVVAPAASAAEPATPP